MKFFIFFTILITISKAISDSLLTGTYDPNSTVLINERRDIKEIDVLRQIINQETLIRLAVVKDVKAVVEDVSFVKRSIATTDAMTSTLQQTIETLKRQVSTHRQDTLALKMETLKRQINALSQNSALHQTIETLKREIDFLRRDKISLNTVEVLKREINTQKREGRKSLENCQNRLLESDQKFKILNENITYIYQYLKRTEEEKGNTIQKRMSGSVSHKTWAEYKNGFGNAKDSYWIGNDVIHQLTKGRNSSLYVSITLRNGRTLNELYQQFSVSDNSDKCRLYLKGPATGTLGDNMLDTGSSTADLSGMSFSTLDRDNDRWRGNCTAYFGGGWWYNACHNTCLNGLWNSSSWVGPWSPKVSYGTSVKDTMMMIKPH